MAKRSIQASTSGIQKARSAFAVKGWTQENLAYEVNLKTRQPIWRFLTGKPVDRYIFLEICSTLDLDWREIAENPSAEFPQSKESAEIVPLNINSLLQQVRSKYHETSQDINQGGILQLLGIGYPICIEDIQIEVNANRVAIVIDISKPKYNMAT